MCSLCKANTLTKLWKCTLIYCITACIRDELVKYFKISRNDWSTGGCSLLTQKLTHPRTGFIFRRIKSLFHHSNWQHIFLISFRLKRTCQKMCHILFCLHNNIKFILIFNENKEICVANLHDTIVDLFQSLKINSLGSSILKIGWIQYFALVNILRSNRTLDCNSSTLQVSGEMCSLSAKQTPSLNSGSVH